MSHIATLRVLVNSMEERFGLDRLTEDERKLIYAMSALSTDDSASVRSEEIKQHPLCRSLSRPTFYRVLRALQDKRVVSRTGSRNAAIYRLQVSRLCQENG